MYEAWRIANSRKDVFRKVYCHLLNCSMDELDDELECQGIKFEDITDEQLYMLIKEYDIDI